VTAIPMFCLLRLSVAAVFLIGVRPNGHGALEWLVPAMFDDVTQMDSLDMPGGGGAMASCYRDAICCRFKMRKRTAYLLQSMYISSYAICCS